MELGRKFYFLVKSLVSKISFHVKRNGGGRGGGYGRRSQDFEKCIGGVQWAIDCSAYALFLADSMNFTLVVAVYHRISAIFLQGALNGRHVNPSSKRLSYQTPPYILEAVGRYAQVFFRVCGVGTFFPVAVGGPRAVPHPRSHCSRNHNKFTFDCLTKQTRATREREAQARKKFGHVLLKWEQILLRANFARFLKFFDGLGNTSLRSLKIENIMVVRGVGCPWDAQFFALRANVQRRH
jgi:hypothetical protein